MKSARYIKLRSFVQEPEDLAMERNNNPLRVNVPSDTLSFITSDNFLEQSKIPVDLRRAAAEPWAPFCASCRNCSANGALI